MRPTVPARWVRCAPPASSTKGWLPDCCGLWGLQVRLTSKRDGETIESGEGLARNKQAGKQVGAVASTRRQPCAHGAGPKGRVRRVQHQFQHLG